MANPMMALGIVTGLVTAFLAYRKKRKIWPALLWSVLVLLGIGTAAHCLIIPAVIAVLVNNLLFRLLKKNWAASLVSLLGVFLVIILLQGTGKLYLTLQMEGPVGIGEAMGAGIAMGLGYIFFILAGTIAYTVTTLIVSILRWRKRKV